MSPGTRLTRRRLLARTPYVGAGLVSALLAGCGGSSDADAEARIALVPSQPALGRTEALGSATGGRSAAGAARAPLDLRVALQPAEVGNGETLLVRASAPGAAGGTLEFAGAAFPMTADGDLLWAIAGVPLEEAPGERTLSVTARGVEAEVLGTASVRYRVVGLERPVDRVTLTAEQASVVTPDGEQRELLLRARQYAQFDRGRRWTAPFLRPTSGPITTQFGEGRSYNGGPVGSFHTGVDYGPVLGTPVLAAAPGRVAWAGEMPIRGRSVILDHGAGVKTGYHHMDTIAANAGDLVPAGATVGTVGQSGLSTGPHLHWEVAVWGVNVDPETWLVTSFLP